MGIPTFRNNSGERGEAAHRAPNLWRLLPSLVLGFVIPLVVYILLRPRVHSEATALAFGGAVPVAWTATRLIWRHRIDPIGVISVVGFAIALAVTVLSGGNPFFLKVHEAPLIGALGLAALVSVAIRRPLLAVVLRLLGRTVPPHSRHIAIATSIIGVTLLVDAATHIVLALTLPTTTYLVVHRMVSWIILGTGVALLLKLRGRARHDHANSGAS